MEPPIAIPERHLGLHGAVEWGEDDSNAMVDTLAGLAEKHIDLDRLVELECGLEEEHSPLSALAEDGDTVRIGVPSDPAFSFLL